MGLTTARQSNLSCCIKRKSRGNCRQWQSTSGANSCSRGIYSPSSRSDRQPQDSHRPTSTKSTWPSVCPSTADSISPWYSLHHPVSAQHLPPQYPQQPQLLPENAGPLVGHSQSLRLHHPGELQKRFPLRTDTISDIHQEALACRSDHLDSRANPEDSGCPAPTWHCSSRVCFRSMQHQAQQYVL